MLRNSLSLAWNLGLGALTLVAGLGALGALFSGEWFTAFAMGLVSILVGWALARRLHARRGSRS